MSCYGEKCHKVPFHRAASSELGVCGFGGGCLFLTLAHARGGMAGSTRSLLSLQGNTNGSNDVRAHPRRSKELNGARFISACALNVKLEI
ncbi:hypothetical protein K440DRAFT_82525 [Wilcoxina mikolae CBS 423.85]|nr:hypothetical protein K440DRAFT_82525 [Wilcoxina mikolae CBS 423.85]